MDRNPGPGSVVGPVMKSAHGRHRRVAVPTAAELVFDAPASAPAPAVDGLRAAVDALGFAETSWDVHARRTAHAAALDLVVLLAGIGPGPEVLLNAAAATLDHARRLVDTTHDDTIHDGPHRPR